MTDTAEYKIGSVADQEPFRHNTRANKYQERFRLPPTLAQVLKDYTREVLREQPHDINRWSAHYFRQLALSCHAGAGANVADTEQQQADEHAVNLPAQSEQDLERLATRMIQIFAGIDDENTGFLYVHLVKRALLEALTLTRPQALYILSSEHVTVNDEGMLQYRQFTRDCLNAVLFFQQSKYSFPQIDHVDTAATVHGMVKEELQDEFLRVMRQVDTEGLGRLPFPAYRDALFNAPLQLTRRDINLLCAEAEQTSDGFIDFRIEVNNVFVLLYLSQSFKAFDEQNA